MQKYIEIGKGIGGRCHRTFGLIVFEFFRFFNYADYYSDVDRTSAGVPKNIFNVYFKVLSYPKNACWGPCGSPAKELSMKALDLCAVAGDDILIDSSQVGKDSVPRIAIAHSVGGRLSCFA